MYAKIISFVFAFLFTSAALAQQDQYLNLTIEWPEQANEMASVLVMSHGGKCLSAMDGTPREGDLYRVAHNSERGGFTWLDHRNPSALVPVGAKFTLCSYELREDSRLYLIPRSGVQDVPYQETPYTYTPKVVVRLPKQETDYRPGGSFSLTANFAVQGVPDAGVMVRGVWYTPAHGVVLVGGVGANFYYLLPSGPVVRPAGEIGLGIGFRYRLNSTTKAMLDGSLAFGGGVGSFRTQCGPKEFDPSREYICGIHQEDGFPVVLTGAWIGAMAKIAVLQPVKAKVGGKEVLLGGQLNLTVPLHLISNDWPRYQDGAGGRTLTARTEDGEETIQYRWEWHLEMITFPVLGGGVVIMW